MIYRKATALDAGALASLRVAMLSEAGELDPDTAQQLSEHTAAFLRAGIEDGSCSAHVALHGDATIAMGGISYFRFPPTEMCLSGKTAYIAGMFTLPAYRGKGIASAILSRLVEEAEALGVERVILKPTAQGKSLYERYGFDPWSDAMVYFP